MKRIFLFLFSLLIFFLLGFGFALLKPQAEAILARTKQPQTHFQPTNYPLRNHPFAIVIVGRNNGAFLDKTLRSALTQNYENYRVIYIDDASDDGSFSLARDLIYDSGSSHRVHLIQNERRAGGIGNLAQAINVCDDEEIVVVLGGEDFLAHEWTLQRLNQYFANPDLWMALGQYMKFPTFDLGAKEPYLEFDLRNQPSRFSFSQLKVFYASLFKKIETSDLIYHGEFMPDTADMAYMIPLFEMAKGHIQLIDEILYLANEKPIKKDETHDLCEAKIKEKEAYFPLYKK